MSPTETITTKDRIPVGDWNADRVHSSVSFSVTYQGVGTFRGGFTDLEATLTGGETPQLTGLARVASVVAQDENLVGHLQSPDFFDAERYPEIRFSGSDFSFEGDDVVIQGELALRGVTLPVELRGTISAAGVDAYGKERIGVSLSTEVDRTAFGVSWNAELPNGGVAVSNETRLEAELSLVKA